MHKVFNKLENDHQFENALLFIFIGQRTGKYGLLKDDFEYYQKKVLHANTFSTLKDNLGLIEEETRPARASTEER